MKPARRPMAMPAMTFSLVASSTKPRGATMRTPAARRALGQDRRDAAEVVDVAVGQDHGDDRRVAEVLARQRDGGRRGLARGQRVDDDPAAVGRGSSVMLEMS